ncbi:MAG: hypothetical protein LBP65_00945 [Puniceicoccales bacterium]|nr:hypothetical protein [Puniceicoccales bacterium]
MNHWEAVLMAQRVLIGVCQAVEKPKTQVSDVPFLRVVLVRALEVAYSCLLIALFPLSLPALIVEKLATGHVRLIFRPIFLLKKWRNVRANGDYMLDLKGLENLSPKTLTDVLRQDVYKGYYFFYRILRNETAAPGVKLIICGLLGAVANHDPGTFVLYTTTAMANWSSSDERSKKEGPILQAIVDGCMKQERVLQVFQELYNSKSLTEALAEITDPATKVRLDKLRNPNAISV